MKGFNLAPPTAQPGMTALPPVAEFIASFQHSTDTPDYYGSTFSGILNSGIQPRRNHMYSMQQFSSSQSSFSESFGTIGKLGKLSSKLRHNNNTSHKRRWGKRNEFNNFYLCLCAVWWAGVSNLFIFIVVAAVFRNSYWCGPIRYRKRFPIHSITFGGLSV